MRMLSVEDEAYTDDDRSTTVCVAQVCVRFSCLKVTCLVSLLLALRWRLSESHGPVRTVEVSKYRHSHANTLI